MKVFLMPNFQCRLSQYCVKLNSVLAALATTMFAKEREYLVVVVFFLLSNFLASFYNSNKPAYDWSSSADLHLWSKCHKSSPDFLRVLYSASSLIGWVWSQGVGADVGRCSLLHPTVLPLRGPSAELFLPIRTLCTKALKQLPLWHDDNVQFHTASWRLTVYYVCKVFFNKSWY